jgi:CheY-like chemotaxis protein
VLVVDDESGIRTLVQRVLMPLGYHVLTAADGLEALDFVAEHDGPIDLLITDVVMPGMGGRELVRRLSERRCCLPVLYLSGYPDSAHTDLTMSNRASSFLMKPFTPSALTRKVRDLLNQSAVRVHDVPQM